MARVIFMGTPEFAVPALQALIEHQTVVAVVTQPDRPAGRGQQVRQSPVKVLAQEAGLPVYQPRSLRQPEKAAVLREWAPDVIVVAAFGQILRPHILELPPQGCINVHASLLPRWRGASPIQHAIMAGDTATGITLMRMDEGLDTGPMYVQRAVPVNADDTAETLHDRLAVLGGEMLAEHLDAILQGLLQPEAQDDSLSTYAPMIKKEAGELDWSRTTAELDRHIRAMTPWPGAFTTWEGAYLKILDATPLTGITPNTPAGVVSQVGGNIVVRTADGALLIEHVQLAGKKAMPAAAFVHGRPEFVGSSLG